MRPVEEVWKAANTREMIWRRRRYSQILMVCTLFGVLQIDRQQKRDGFFFADNGGFLLYRPENIPTHRDIFTIGAPRNSFPLYTSTNFPTREKQNHINKKENCRLS